MEKQKERRQLECTEELWRLFFKRLGTTFAPCKIASVPKQLVLLLKVHHTNYWFDLFFFHSLFYFIHWSFLRGELINKSHPWYILKPFTVITLKPLNSRTLVYFIVKWWMISIVSFSNKQFWSLVQCKYESKGKHLASIAVSSNQRFMNAIHSVIHSDARDCNDLVMHRAW